MGQLKAYGLLAEQPLSASNIDDEESRNIVISAIIDEAGVLHILSTFNDNIWELWPFFEQSNVDPSKKSIDWSRIPAKFRAACKAVCYRYWMVGLPGVRRPAATSLTRFVQELTHFTKYMDGLGLESLATVQPLHMAAYVNDQKKLQGPKPNSLLPRFVALEKLFHFSGEHPDGLKFHPWPDSSSWAITSGNRSKKGERFRSSSTPLIPMPVAIKLFGHAESILKGADTILDDRDAGRRIRRRVSPWRDRDIMKIRDACFFLIGILTGMRCEELVGLEIGAGRTEIKNGIKFHWIKATEHKTLKGRVEYLMPSIGHEILRIMERVSAPFRQALSDQLANPEQMSLQDIAEAKASQFQIFLGIGHRRISAMSGSTWAMIMQRFAIDAGTDWHLAPHQLRRLYAWTFVHHRLGNILFLKEQFKHSSLDMSQLYASNPMQDAALYDEILDEIRSQKSDIIQNWLFDDSPLAGGAGKKIMLMRAHDFPDRKAMIVETSQRLHLRSTGHGWCLAQDDGCGGKGLYEQTLCGDCGNGVIDRTFNEAWKGIFNHQLELLSEAAEIGLGGVQRVQRDLEKSKRVLQDLGIEIGVTQS